MKITINEVNGFKPVTLNIHIETPLDFDSITSLFGGLSGRLIEESLRNASKRPQASAMIANKFVCDLYDVLSDLEGV